MPQDIGQVTVKRRPLARTPLRARYDSAQTTDENRNHWAAADALSADAALSSTVRQRLRIRGRYEVANNSYAKGIGETIVNDTVGTGPRLQMTEGSAEDNAIVETLFWEWATEIGLAAKLRQMRFARYDSGESFAVFTSNEKLKHPVKLDIRVYEAEEIADPTYDTIIDPQWVDGINYDEFGNPVSYRKLKHHPGSFGWMSLPNEYEDIRAEFVWHYYKADRPGQHRGIPDITPALQLFAELRRYCAAVIAAAETAADFAVVLQSEAPPGEASDNNGADTELDDFDTVGLAKRMGTILPKGYTLNQVKTEQPITTYDQFIGAKLKEIARCVSVPYHIAALDAGATNMSSAYVVGQPYVHDRKVDRVQMQLGIDRIFAMWLAEARLIPGLLPELPEKPPHEWFWDSLGHHADPQKVANARATNLASGLTNIPREYSMDGLDWEEQQDLGAKALGISVPEYRELIRNKLFGVKPDEPSEQPDEPKD